MISPRLRPNGVIYQAILEIPVADVMPPSPTVLRTKQGPIWPVAGPRHAGREVGSVTVLDYQLMSVLPPATAPAWINNHDRYEVRSRFPYPVS